MIHFRSEFLFPARISRFGVCAANVAGDDARTFAYFFQCPDKIANIKSAVFPIRDGFFLAEAIKVNRYVDVCAGKIGGKVFELLSPIFRQDRPTTFSIFHAPAIRPRMHLKFVSPFSATVSENLIRPPTFEIAATPYTYRLHIRKFERAINPTSAAPFRRPDVPVWVIIERNDCRRPAESAKPERS